MKVLRFLLLAVLVAALGGCATVYTLDGKTYSSSTEFLAASATLHAATLAQVAPLPAPVTKKRLAFMAPSPQGLLNIMLRYHVIEKGAQPVPHIREMYANLATARSQGARAFADAAAKRNIYSAVRYIPTEDATPSPLPSADEDVLYYSESGPGAGQYFYVSAKWGKQIFAFDRSEPGAAGQTRAFNEALQLQAIRD